MPGPSNNASKKKRKGGGGGGNTSGAKKPPPPQQQTMPAVATQQVQKNSPGQGQQHPMSGKGGRKQHKNLPQKTNSVATAATTESVVYVTDTHGENGKGRERDRGVLVEDDYYDDEGDSIQGYESHRHHHYDECPTPSQTQNAHPETGTRYSRCPSQPLQLWHHAKEDSGRSEWIQGPIEAGVEEVERGRTRYRYRTTYKPASSHAHNDDSRPLVQPSNMKDLDTARGPGSGDESFHSKPGNDYSSVHIAGVDSDNRSKRLPQMMTTQSQPLQIHSQSHSQTQPPRKMHLTQLQSQPHPYLHSSSTSSLTSASGFVSSPPSSQVLTPSPAFGMGIDDGEPQDDGKRDGQTGSEPMVEIVLPEPFAALHAERERQVAKRDSREGTKTAAQSKESGEGLKERGFGSPLSEEDVDQYDYYEYGSECSDEECDCKSSRWRERRRSGETMTSVYSGSSKPPSDQIQEQEPEDQARRSPSPALSNSSSYHSAVDDERLPHNGKGKGKARQEARHKSEVPRLVEASWVHAIEQSLENGGYDTSKYRSSQQSPLDQVSSSTHWQSRWDNEIDREKEVLSRIMPFIHDPGNGPRVRDVKAFLRCPYFAQAPALDDPLCAEFAQDEVLEMLLMVLPEEMALILWYNKSRWTSRVCPACQRLYRVGDILPKHMYGEEGDEPSTSKAEKQPSPILKKEQGLSGLCSPICFILASFNHPGAIKYAWGNTAQEMDERVWEILNGPGTGTAKSEVAVGLSMLVRMTRLGDLGLGDLFMYDAVGEEELENGVGDDGVDVEDNAEDGEVDEDEGVEEYEDAHSGSKDVREHEADVKDECRMPGGPLAVESESQQPQQPSAESTRVRAVKLH